MQKASGTLWRIVRALILTSTLAGTASASEFLSHKKPDPKRFAQAVAAYDVHNYAQAYEIWLPLARHGDLAALFNVGLMLRDGRGIPADLPRALSFFSQCAKQEHLGCQVNLADMYDKGIGSPQNYAEAAHWLTVAARRGHFPSMYKLAGMYERGEGVEVNLKAAKLLYLTAYQGGYQFAGRRLSELAAGSVVSPGQAAGPLPSAEESNRSPMQPAGLTVTPLPPPPSLRGTIGTDDSRIDDSSGTDWSLRASFAGDPLQMAPETADLLDRAIAAESTRPRICQIDPEAFDAHPAMCRMPPVRN